MTNFDNFISDTMTQASVEFGDKVTCAVVLFVPTGAPAEVINVHMSGVIGAHIRAAFEDLQRRVKNAADDAGWEILSFKQEEEPGSNLAVYTVKLPEGFSYQLNLI